MRPVGTLSIPGSRIMSERAILPRQTLLVVDSGVLLLILAEVLHSAPNKADEAHGPLPHKASSRHYRWLDG